MPCNNCIQTQQIDCGCNPSPCQEQDCECPVLGMTSDCVKFTEDLECSGIEANQTLTETIVQLDAFICEKFDQQNAYFTLVNTGTGSEVYKGVNGQGQKQIRKINSSDDLINVTQNTDDISVSIDQDELSDFVDNLIPDYNANNVGNGAEIFKEEVSNEFIFRTLTSIDNSVTINENTDTIDLSVALETTIEEGTNITITGTGTSEDPYIINGVPADVNISDGVTTTVTGDGSVGNPYIVEVNALKRVQVISTNYTLQATDNNYLIFIDNGASDVTITIPDSLPTNFSVGFIQKGTGEVSFIVASLAVINTPIGNKIKGQFYDCLLEKELSTQDYYLCGDLKL